MTDQEVMQQEQQAEPVAWRTFDGEGGYDYRTYQDNEDYAAEWAKRNPRHVGWVDPLYTTPPQRKALTINEVEQILAQHSYEIHGDRARYIVRMTEEAHGIGETP